MSTNRPLKGTSTAADDEIPIITDEFAREHSFIKYEAELTAEVFPKLTSFPVRCIYQLLPIPDEPPPPPEYVFIAKPDHKRGQDREEYWKHRLFVSSWNMTWDAGFARRGFLGDEVPIDLAWVLDSEVNVRLVYGDTKHNYDAYAPLYHLLPRQTLDLFGLPYLRRGGWPMLRDEHLLENILPKDFNQRLANAISYHLWPRLNSRAVPSCYSREEPILTLAHNLDYWMPYIDLVAQERALEWGRTEIDEPEQQAAYEEHKDEMPLGITIKTPLYGGPLWIGEDEANDATAKMIELADSHGNLRAIIDAIKSNRIEDDFSDRWSFEREDFERKLYSKRNKVKVTFVQLDETIPVHGQQSEIHESLLWEDFMAFLDEKERRVVVCLRNGVTKLGEIAATLGYANHSPVSKQLQRIRMKAKRLLEV